MAASAFAIVGVSSFAAPVFAQGKPSIIPPPVSNCGDFPSTAGACAREQHPRPPG